ncbi:MAG: sigma-70 family RNA polymerase sigma factor [Planctomycetes bacterium]|jgi:RNA polymerase sigma-70 factor (ECF subfamily)|nr:sigma-70 family RNA polymerase sigma factor [Planctomycetota bacterium]
MAGLEQVNLDDLELVHRARNRDPEAFQTLVYRYQDRVFNTAFRLMGDRSLAEDIAQEVFFKAYDSLRKFKEKSSFSTWLYRIALNTCTSAWRRAGAQKRAGEVALPASSDDAESPRWEPSAPDADPREAILRRERNALVQKAIRELEEEFRAALVLRDIEGLSYEEIAEIIQHPVGTVRSRIHRARSDLKEKLKDLL